jgi:hypothetical protein
MCAHDTDLSVPPFPVSTCAHLTSRGFFRVPEFALGSKVNRCLPSLPHKGRGG